MQFRSRNTNTLAPQVYKSIRAAGVACSSRNGDVLRFPETVMITLTHPWERVNFSPARDANPFFHLVEAMAMIADYNSVAVLSYYAKNMENYSDDGETFNSFYGTRMHKDNQLLNVIQNLKANPDSRQELVMLWDPQDLTKRTKDKACNFAMLFEVFQGKLRMNSFNRSNDAIWGGVTGANIVHFSFFQEFVAGALGLPMGDWTHTSANLHVYTANPKLEGVIKEADELGVFDAIYPDEDDCYKLHGSHQGRIRFDHELFIDELRTFFSMHEALQEKGGLPALEVCSFSFSFLQHVMLPMVLAWAEFKGQKRPSVINNWIHRIDASDWQRAARLWMDRRLK